jgi:hypothetical protein
MAERDLLAAAFIEEVLGPRDGAWELMDSGQDPLDEYITGVLAPRDAPEQELDSEDEELGEDEFAGDDQADPGGSVAPAGTAVPALDPRSRPASLGISFSVRANEGPIINIRCTWARYEQTAHGWQRSPRLGSWDSVDCSDTPPLISPADPGVQVVVRASHRDTAWRISIFLVNTTPASTGMGPRTPEHIFQPQIRISCR